MQHDFRNRQYSTRITETKLSVKVAVGAPSPEAHPLLPKFGFQLFARSQREGVVDQQVQSPLLRFDPLENGLNLPIFRHRKE